MGREFDRILLLFPDNGDKKNRLLRDNRGGLFLVEGLLILKSPDPTDDLRIEANIY